MYTIIFLNTGRPHQAKLINIINEIVDASLMKLFNNLFVNNLFVRCIINVVYDVLVILILR